MSLIKKKKLKMSLRNTFNIYILYGSHIFNIQETKLPTVRDSKIKVSSQWCLYWQMILFGCQGQGCWITCLMACNHSPPQTVLPRHYHICTAWRNYKNICLTHLMWIVVIEVVIILLVLKITNSFYSQSEYLKIWNSIYKN